MRFVLIFIAVAFGYGVLRGYPAIDSLGAAVVLFLLVAVVGLAADRINRMGR